DAIDQRRLDANTAQQTEDARVLAKAQSTLRAKASNDYAQTAAQIKADSAANLRQRQQVLQAQTGPAASLPALPDLRSAVTMLSNYYEGRFRNDVTSMVDAFIAARADLNARMGVLRSMHANGRTSVDAELTRLINDRRRLAAQIDAQIMAAARKT